MKEKILKFTEIGARLWLGYILIINSGVGIITPLEELGMPDHIYNIIKGMWDTGFMMHLVKATELIAGVSLLLNAFVPLALVALVPVVVNIYGMHIFLFNSIHSKGLYMLLICVFLVYRNREIFKPLLVLKRNNHV